MQTITIDRSKNWTVDDYLLLGEMKTPCQLINGELIMSPAPNPSHQRVLRKLFKVFDNLNPQGEIFFAPIDLFINKLNVYQPDLIYLSEVGKKFISNRGIEGPPDIIVEIISPSNIFTDRNIKKRIYLDFGVKEYWIVDPGNKTLEIYLHTQSNPDVPHLYLAEDGPVISTVLTDLAFDLKEIFIG
jgi:Uma2 family endonuclease